jgi:(5-formylfuran-3-yl)methyl phosphate synthase
MSRPIQLLVSVADATEARDATAGGADVIDAKDPEQGPLGAVSLTTLRQIHMAVAGRRPVSAALGDADDEGTVERVAGNYAATGIGFVKIGFAGITCVARVRRLITAAVRGARATNSTRCGVVAVAYADTGGTTSVNKTALIGAAADAGASGVLLDTADKEGPGLSRLVSLEQLAAWVATAHDCALTVALAGKVTLDDLPFVSDAGADIVGVRGAACDGGRTSRVVEAKVRALIEHSRLSVIPRSDPPRG